MISTATAVCFERSVGCILFYSLFVCPLSSGLVCLKERNAPCLVRLVRRDMKRCNIIVLVPITFTMALTLTANLAPPSSPVPLIRLRYLFTDITCGDSALHGPGIPRRRTRLQRSRPNTAGRQPHVAAAEHVQPPTGRVDWHFFGVSTGLACSSSWAYFEYENVCITFVKAPL